MARIRFLRVSKVHKRINRSLPKPHGEISLNLLPEIRFRVRKTDYEQQLHYTQKIKNIIHEAKHNLTLFKVASRSKLSNSKSNILKPPIYSQFRNRNIKFSNMYPLSTEKDDNTSLEPVKGVTLTKIYSTGDIVCI
jgi:hypothetical protein